jgi:hypothetical protein
LTDILVRQTGATPGVVAGVERVANLFKAGDARAVEIVVADVKVLEQVTAETPK